MNGYCMHSYCMRGYCMRCSCMRGYCMHSCCVCITACTVTVCTVTVCTVTACTVAVCAVTVCAVAVCTVTVCTATVCTTTACTSSRRHAAPRALVTLSCPTLHRLLPRTRLRGLHATRPSASGAGRSALACRSPRHSSSDSRSRSGSAARAQRRCYRRGTVPQPTPRCPTAGGCSRWNGPRRRSSPSMRPSASAFSSTKVSEHADGDCRPCECTQ